MRLANTQHMYVSAAQSNSLRYEHFSAIIVIVADALAITGFLSWYVYLGNNVAEVIFQTFVTL